MPERSGEMVRQARRRSHFQPEHVSTPVDAGAMSRSLSDRSSLSHVAHPVAQRDGTTCPDPHWIPSGSGGKSITCVGLAGEPGFEPGLTESESVGLPLTYSPTAFTTKELCDGVQEPDGTIAAPGLNDTDRTRRRCVSAAPFPLPDPHTWTAAACPHPVHLRKFDHPDRAPHCRPAAFRPI